MKYLHAFLFCFAYSLIFSQNIDSFAIKKIDSLLKESRNLIGKNELKKALEVNSIAENLALEKFGNKSIAYANVSYNIGRIYYFQGDFGNAEKNYITTREIQKKILGQYNTQYASTLQSLAIINEEKGDFSVAKEFYLEAQSIFEKVTGKESTEYASISNSLGIFYFKMGEFPKAESYYILAKEIREKIFGRQSLNYASSLNNLGALYSEIGDYQYAESNYLEALAIRLNLLGESHPLYAKTLNNLAILYDKLGNFEKSKKYAYLGIEIRKKALGKYNLDYATSLNTLSNILVKNGEFKEAEFLLLDVKEIRDSLLGKEHPEYAKVLNNLAILYQKQGFYKLAEAHFIESKNISEKIYGKDNPEYAKALANLAGFYKEINSTLEAENLYIESNNILHEVFGPMHPEYALNNTNLAMIYIDLGEFQKATNYIQQLIDLNFIYLSSACHFMSEKELFDYQYKILANHYLMFSKIQFVPADLFSKVLYDYCLGFKGTLLDFSIKIKQLALTNPESQKYFENLKLNQRLLSIEYSKPRIKQTNIDEKVTKVNELEKAISKSLPSYLKILKQTRWQEILPKLNFGEVAIEFVHFNNGVPTDSTMYSALILVPGDTTPHFVPLFEEKELNKLLKTSQSRRMDYVADLYNNNNRGTFPLDIKTKTLYELIWKPMEPFLVGVNRIYFSPSGLLHRINQNAIAIDEKKIMSDKYELVLLGSTRQLVSNEIQQDHKILDVCIYGGINFNIDSTELIASIQNKDNYSFTLRSGLDFSYTDSTLRGDTWNYLNGSEHEANEIYKIMGKAGIKPKLFKGSTATEESLKKLGDFKTESPQILHISTHGYFFPDPKESNRAKTFGLQDEPVFKISEHPMLRSGLILAGANYAWKAGKPIKPEAEDGILTAYEISQLNLRNTELVVLSACETGLGEIQGNEGVYGLQRAFKIAGAKNLIMSLWQVPDQQTSELMTSFYKYWLVNKKSIRESLKLAQNDLRKKGFEAFYWAGFVLVE